MTVYHPGKVVAVFSPASKDVESADKSTQALLEMWDENIFTCDVDKLIAGKLKEGDVVLVDYNPVSQKMPIPRQVVTKVLHGATAKKTWEKYTESHRKKKEKETSSAPKMMQGPPPQLYG